MLREKINESILYFRSNYVAAHFAANMMIPNKQGLIITVSSPAGLGYFLNVPDGVGKAAVFLFAFIMLYLFYETGKAERNYEWGGLEIKIQHFVCFSGKFHN